MKQEAYTYAIMTPLNISQSQGSLRCIWRVHTEKQIPESECSDLHMIGIYTHTMYVGEICIIDIADVWLVCGSRKRPLKISSDY